MKLLYYIHSRRVYSIDIDSDWIEPTNESEFTSVVEKINTKNLNKDQFPVDINWIDYNIWLSSENISDITKNLRSQRDMQLKNSDWLLTYDNVQSLANLDEWINYRQRLRDLFLNVSDIKSLKMPDQPKIIRKII